MLNRARHSAAVLLLLLIAALLLMLMLLETRQVLELRTPKGGRTTWLKGTTKEKL